MIIFEADDPRVLDGTYDQEGYTLKERRAQHMKHMKFLNSWKKADRQEDRPMAKRTHRITTVKSNGGRPESKEVAPDALGDVVIDDTLAPEQMRLLAQCYEDVARARTAYEAKKEAAKVAKLELEIKTDFLLEKVRLFTHPTALPLFDLQKAEADRDAMVAG